MNKTVKCPACNEAYNLDLDKYGGKRIKCKKCQAVISVPTASDAQDEFEVVEDDSPQVSAAVPPSILQRHRMASQRGAVNIALLQRNEPSREEIRLAFLELHGSEASRLPDSILTISEAEDELDHRLESLPDAELLDWMRDVLSRALVYDPKAVCPHLTKTSGPLLSGGLLGMYKSFLVGPTKEVKKGITDEDAFPAAVKILGCPIRPMPEKIDKDYGFDWEGQQSKDNEARNLLIREIKIDTIKAAIEVSENTKTMLLSEKAELQKEWDNLIAAHAKQCGVELGRVRVQLQEGRLAEATLALQDLLKTAPVKLLGQVSIALSQCTYLSGNPSNAARHIQDAICFGASAPVDMDEGYNDLWAKASSGLPRS
jgi:hypothetical protein